MHFASTVLLGKQWFPKWQEIRGNGLSREQVQVGGSADGGLHQGYAATRLPTQYRRPGFNLERVHNGHFLALNGCTVPGFGKYFATLGLVHRLCAILVHFDAILNPAQGNFELLGNLGILEALD